MYQFITFWGLPVLNECIFSANMLIILCRASRVFHAICGVTNVWGALRIGLSAVGGSVVSTSVQYAPNFPLCKASATSSMFLDT